MGIRKNTTKLTINSIPSKMHIADSRTYFITDQIDN
jgi:hypothetical protein